MKKPLAAGVSKKSPKAGPVDAKGAYTKVQERTLGNMKKGGKMKKAQDGVTERGPLSAIPAAGATRTQKQKERSADGNYVKVTKMRETPAGTKAVEKTRRTVQGILRGAPRVATYKKGGKMSKKK